MKPVGWWAKSAGSDGELESQWWWALKLDGAAQARLPVVGQALIRCRRHPGSRQRVQKLTAPLRCPMMRTVA